MAPAPQLSSHLAPASTSRRHLSFFVPDWNDAGNHHSSRLPGFISRKNLAQRTHHLFRSHLASHPLCRGTWQHRSAHFCAPHLWLLLDRPPTRRTKVPLLRPPHRPIDGSQNLSCSHSHHFYPSQKWLDEGDPDRDVIHSSPRPDRWAPPSGRVCEYA